VVADLTHVATWSGFVYVAFVIDAFSRFLVAAGRPPVRSAPTWR
jgi:transposase InsO family protein